MVGPRPVLLCFDGSENAARAIGEASTLLTDRAALVLTVWEPAAVWEPYDPVGIISSGVAKLGSAALGLDEIASEIAAEKLERGLTLAREAGFDVEGRVVHGKTWRAICELADEVDAAVIVLGARGLSRVRSAVLGSVSSAVLVHSNRPVLVVHHRAA